MVTGWLNQRDFSRLSDGTADRPVYVAGINIIGLEDNVVSANAEWDALQEQKDTINMLLSRADERQDFAFKELNAYREDTDDKKVDASFNQPLESKVSSFRQSIAAIEVRGIHCGGPSTLGAKFEEAMND